MITPKWLNTKSQPIAVRNVLQFLNKVLNNKEVFDKSFDIGGPEILTYKEMLLKFAKVRKLKRTIITLPILTPKLSSYWLYFVTSTSYKLAATLVNSMKIEVICKNSDLTKKFDIKLLSYEKAVTLAFEKTVNQDVISSWTDAQSSKVLNAGISKLIEVPLYGCFVDKRISRIVNEKKSLDKIWQIGGKTGWYYGNWLWSIRGFLDKLFGGVGLRRGRRSENKISAGDSLDFWRVLYADKNEKRLLLYMEI